MIEVDAREKRETAQHELADVAEKGVVVSSGIH